MCVCVRVCVCACVRGCVRARVRACVSYVLCNKKKNMSTQGCLTFSLYVIVCLIVVLLLLVRCHVLCTRMKVVI